MLDQILQEYRDDFDAIRGMGDVFELYQHIISLGKELQKDPLSKTLRTDKNRVSYCQFQLFVDYEDNRWKSYSDGMISSGYAYILTDVFNKISLEEAAKVNVETFDALGIQDILSMNRASGFKQMIEIMRKNAIEKL